MYDFYILMFFMVIWHAHADNIINVTRNVKCNTKVFNEQPDLDIFQRLYEMFYIFRQSIM